MLIENEQVNSGESFEASPEPQSTPDQSAESQKPQGEQLEAKQTQPDNTPFHEHPRFKELVEQKNNYAKELQAYQQRQADLERRMAELSKPKPEAPKEDALISRLMGIDEEFGGRFKTLAEQAAMASKLQERLDQMEQQQFVSQAVSTIKNLHTEMKVSPDAQARYDRELDWAYKSGQIRSIDDVQKVYKQVHEAETKYLDAVRRAERESYLTTKKADAKAPATQPKGKPVNQDGKAEWSKDPTVRRQQAIQKILSQANAESDI